MTASGTELVWFIGSKMFRTEHFGPLLQPFSQHALLERYRDSMLPKLERHFEQFVVEAARKADCFMRQRWEIKGGLRNRE